MVTGYRAMRSLKAAASDPTAFSVSVIPSPPAPCRRFSKVVCESRKTWPSSVVEMSYTLRRCVFPLSSVNQKSETLGERAAKVVLDLVGRDSKGEATENRLQADAGRPRFKQSLTALPASGIAQTVGSHLQLQAD